MTVRAFPFDGVFVHEEDYLALQSAQRGGGIIGNPAIHADAAALDLGGVVRYSNNFDLAAALHVTPGAGRSVNINIGRAMAPGFMLENDAVVNVPVTVNTSGSTRYDTVVARFDFDANEGEFDVIAGGAPTRAFPIWEERLAVLRVPDGFATLTFEEVIDRRRFVGDRVPLRGFGAGTGQARYYPVGFLGHSTEVVIGAQTAYFVPFVTGVDVGLSKVSILTGQAAPSGTLRLALYRAGTSGRGMPDDAMFDLGSMVLADPDTLYEVGVSDVRFANPQAYWLAVGSLSGASVGPVKCGFVALTTGGASLAEPPIHVGGVSLAAPDPTELSSAAYMIDGLASVWPDPVDPADLVPTAVSPVGFLTGG